MGRMKDRIGVEWRTPENFGWEHVSIEVLMDIRAEARKHTDLLQRLVSIMECHNTHSIPHTLKRIDKRLAKNLPLRSKS